MISGEFIRAIVTVIPVLLAMWWVLKLQGHLWRRTIWTRVGADVRRLEAELGGQVSYRWTGYQLAGDGWRVRWVGGLGGENTVIRTPSGKHRLPGLLDGAAVRRVLKP